MKFTLRDYQKEFCRAVVDAFAKGVGGQRFTRLLGIAATGAGKTIMAAALIWYIATKLHKRALFLADTDELCDQAIKKLRASAGIIADLEKASSIASLRSKVVVGSIQTIMGESRLERFPADHFDIVIADEAHLSLADGWQRVLKRFNGGGANVLGITATPDRLDGKQLLKFYEHIAYEITLKQLIESKHLSPITVEMAPISITINSRISDGDENEQMADELSQYYDRIAEEILKRAGDRKSILIFHPSIKASKAFAEKLQKLGFAADHVDGTTKDRKERLERFELGQTRFMNNAQLLMKGYDNPRIDCVVILRLTKSSTQYKQMAGRGTRLFCPHGCDEWCEHSDRKQDMLLLDFLWQTLDHGLMTPACLATDSEEQAATITRMLRDNAGEKFDILNADMLAISERETMLLSALKRAHKRGGHMRLTSQELAALLHQPALLDYTPRAQWEQGDVRKAHAAMLKHHGLDPKSIHGAGHAVKLLNLFDDRKKHGLATPEQVLKLAINGHQSPHLLTQAQAAAIL